MGVFMNVYKRSEIVTASILSILAALFLVTTIAEVPFLENTVMFIVLTVLLALLFIFVLVGGATTKTVEIPSLLLGLLIILGLPIFIRMLLFSSLEENVYFGYGIFMLAILYITLIAKKEYSNEEKATVKKSKKTKIPKAKTYTNQA